MEKTAQDYAHIPGWGMDADPKNNPTYPYKHRTNAEHAGFSWPRPTLQPVNIELLKSVELPGVTAVFGTSAPPAGLSGIIRRYAFKFSENEYAHWLPLLLADRVNVVEGIIDDLKRGHIPNIFAEQGWKSAWKFDRQGTVKKVVVGAVVATAVAAVLFGKKVKARKS